MNHGPLTQAALDALYAEFLFGTPRTRSGRPVFTLVVTRKTKALLEDSWMREHKRRARRKAKLRR